MKKQLTATIIFCIIALTGGIYGAFKLGFSMGVEHHKDTQIVYGAGSDFYSEYNGQVDHYYYDEPCTTVQNVISMDNYDNILIKDSQGYIIYNGAKDGLTLNQKESVVTGLAVCEDTENTLCIFVQ